MVVSDDVVVGVEVGVVVVAGAGVDTGVSAVAGVDDDVVGAGSLEVGVVVVEEGAAGAVSSARAISGLLMAISTDALTSSTVLLICLIDRILPPYLSLLTWYSGEGDGRGKRPPDVPLGYCLVTISWLP